MAIYSEKIKKHKRWLEAFHRYELISGFEPMHQEAIDAGEMTIREGWYLNVNWLDDMTNDATNFAVPGD